MKTGAPQWIPVKTSSKVLPIAPAWTREPLPSDEQITTMSSTSSSCHKRQALATLTLEKTTGLTAQHSPTFQRSFSFTSRQLYNYCKWHIQTNRTDSIEWSEPRIPGSFGRVWFWKTSQIFYFHIRKWLTDSSLGYQPSRTSITSMSNIIYTPRRIRTHSSSTFLLKIRSLTLYGITNS